MKLVNHLFAVLLCTFSFAAEAVEQLQVQGLFSGKAVLMIDGKRHVLAIGETSPEGVRVIAADSKSAILEIEGEQKKYMLGTQITTQYKKRPVVREQIVADARGMYFTFGNINGHSVKFLVDTGATTVAMNALDARRLGIQYRINGVPTTANTASGIAKAWAVRLKTVKIGQLKRTNVPALVIDGSHPTEVLLGMSFLGELKVSKEQGTMILEQKR